MLANCGQARGQDCRQLWDWAAWSSTDNSKLFSSMFTLSIGASLLVPAGMQAPSGTTLIEPLRIDRILCKSPSSRTDTVVDGLNLARTCREQVVLFLAFRRLTPLPTASANAVPAPDSRVPLRPPGAFAKRKDLTAKVGSGSGFGQGIDQGHDQA